MHLHKTLQKITDRKIMNTCELKKLYIPQCVKGTVLRNKNAEICISEDFGVKCFYSGKFYDVILDDTIADLHGGKLSQVEQDLFSRFFLSDKHSSFAKIG